MGNKIFIVVSLCCVQAVIAQPYNFRYFNQTTGLSSSNVKKILQDNNGFIWMGTQDGVTRFDGKNTLIFKKPFLTGTDVSDIFFDEKKGWLWIGYSLGGINAIDTRNLKIVYNSQNKKNISAIATNTIRSIIRDSKEKLWIGTENGLFCIPNIDKDSAQTNTFPIKENIANPIISGLAEDNSGNIIAGLSGAGIIIMEQGNINSASLLRFSEKDFTIYNSFFSKKRNLLFLSGNLGIFSYSATRGLLQLLPQKKSNKEAFPQATYYATEDANGDIWASTSNGVFKIDKNNNFSPIEFSEGKKTDLRNIALNIYFDKLNNIWIGTMAGCYYSSRVSSLFTKILKTQKGNPLNHLYFLYPQNQYLLACDETGLYKMDFSLRQVKILDSIEFYKLFFKDLKGNTLFSTSHGLFIWDSVHENKRESAKNIYPELEVIKSNTLSSIVYTKDSLIILGSDNNTGIYIWNIIKHTVTHLSDTTSPHRLKDASIISLYKKNDYEVFILTNKSLQLLNLKNYHIKYLTYHFPGMSYFYDMIFMQSKYFISSYGSGIIEADTSFKIHKIFNLQNGLSDNCVYRIIPENDSVFWATTNFGLNRVNVNSGKISKYYTQDGLHSNEFEEYSANKDSKYIYVGGLNGFTIIDPSKFTINTTPPTFYYTNIKTKTTDSAELDTSNLEIKQLTIPKTWLQTTISFVGLNYSNPERVTYQYRIKERDTNWINNNTTNFIPLIGLSPGTYTLEVKAANEDGYWCAPKQLTLIFEPKWYQTLWFEISVGLAIAGLFYAFYRYRISQIKKQQQIRKDIASDLHDDIGSTLNSVKIFTHLAETAPEKQEYFNQIKDALKQASAGLRDMIWVLDDTQDNIEELIKRLKQFAVPVANVSNINIEFAIDDKITNDPLNKTEKRNLLLIAKEAINNSIKYAGCKKIHISISKINGKTSLQIHDDGKGFGMSDITPGNGLKNMQDRARQIHYKVNITSSPENGTTIIVTNNK